MATATTDTLSRDTTPELEAAQQLEEAARFLDLEKWIIQRLRYCERETQVFAQVTNDSGESRVFRASRVQHATVRGPGMGPLRFSKRLSTSELHAMAMNLTWQWALWKLPFSGSAGVIAADMDELSEREARSLTSYYVDQLQGTIGPQLDVITPARDSHPQVMAWALSALGAADGRTLSTIAGKPVSLGGVDLHGIAARFFRALFTCATKQFGIATPRVAFLGFDPLARRMALELERTGTRIVGIADRSGGVFDASGLHLSTLVQHVEREQVLFGCPEAQPISVEDLLNEPYDVLVLCAPEGLMQSTSARLVFETGGHVHFDLPAKTSVIPPLLADFGLSFASFCEWRKNSSGGFTDVDGLRGLPVHVRNTWREVYEYAQKREMTLRAAALTLAVSRVAEAMRLK